MRRIHAVLCSSWICGQTIWNKMCKRTKDIEGREKSLPLILRASEVILHAAHLTTNPDVPFDYIIYSCFCTLS